MLEVSIAESRELSDADLRTAETLVRKTFGTHFRTHDWIHAVGGAHVLITDDDVMVAHAAVVPRKLQHADTVFDTGYVEAVAVHTDHQGRGLGRVVMDHAESLIRIRYELGALNAVRDAEHFYVRRGWSLWDGPTGAVTPSGIIDTFDPADRIYLLAQHSDAPLATDVPLMCDWRAGDLW